MTGARPVAGCWSTCDGREGPVVVVVHGTMDRSSSFARAARTMPDWRVVRYDRRGYGRSLHLGPPAAFDQQVEDLVEVVRRHTDEPVVLLGHSYGGTISATLASRRPDLVAAVAVYEAPMPWVDWWPARSAGAAAVADGADPADAAERFMRTMVGDRQWERLPPTTRAARRDEGPTLVAEMAQMRPPNPAPFDPAAIRVPLVAGHGTESKPHHTKAARLLAAEAPAGALAVCDGAGHGVHLTDPRAFTDLARQVHARAAPA